MLEAMISSPAAAEAAFTLSVVLGKQNARLALRSDITLLGLPPAQIELPLSVLR
jgi:hypothetical protein